MEDVIVQRTTTRSTTQNPKKQGASVIIEGDNVNIGTLIVNSPNTHVDNSVRVAQVQQQQNNGSSGQSTSGNYNNDRDFFKGIEKVLPQILMGFVPIFVK